MNENELQNRIRCELSKYGVCLRRHVGEFVTKNGDTIKIGVPGESDLEFIGDGFVAFIEVKTPTGRVSTAQRRFIETVRKMGHKAGIARSVEDALNIIRG
jgi:hypothetical protein